MPSQRAVAELWMGMVLRGVCGRGTLSLCADREADCREFALACVGAGGALLMLLTESEIARRAAQSGAVDFTVDFLGEALRILKNELRQKRAIVVALVGPIEEHVTAMALRGVQPQFVEGQQGIAGVWTAFLERGAVQVAPEDLKAEALRSAAEEGFYGTVQTAGSAAERREQDDGLRTKLPVAAPGALQQAAHRWLQIAPQLFPRDRDRVLWVSKEDGEKR